MERIDLVRNACFALAPKSSRTLGKLIAQAIHSTTFTTMVRTREPRTKREYPDPPVVRPSLSGSRRCGRCEASREAPRGVGKRSWPDVEEHDEGHR
jgi:hypothetical protein